VSFSVSTATSTAAIYPLSLHDALPILGAVSSVNSSVDLASHSGIALPWIHRCNMPPSACAASTASRSARVGGIREASCDAVEARSEEHTSELQSRFDLVCRLLLEKKKI